MKVISDKITEVRLKYLAASGLTIEAVPSRVVEKVHEFQDDEYKGLLGIPADAEIHETYMKHGKVCIRWSSRA